MHCSLGLETYRVTQLARILKAIAQSRVITDRSIPRVANGYNKFVAVGSLMVPL